MPDDTTDQMDDVLPTAPPAEPPAAGQPDAEPPIGETIRVTLLGFPSSLAAGEMAERASAGAAIQRRWLARAAEDWASPKLLEHLKAKTAEPRSSLVLHNRIAFIGSDELYSDLADFCGVHRVPVEYDLSAVLAEGIELLLVEGAWLRVENPWRNAVLDCPQGSSGHLYELIRALRSRGVPTALWMTGEHDSRRAFRHLSAEADRTFVAGPPDNGRGDIQLDPAVNVKRFSSFKVDRKEEREVSPWLNHIVDGTYELGHHVGGEDALAALAPYLDYNAWLVDSSYELRNNSGKLPPQLRRRFAGCLREGELPYLFRVANTVFYPKAVVNSRPVFFARRARQAAACKTLTLAQGGVAAGAGAGTIGIDAAAQLGDTLASFKADPIAMMARQHLAWREAVSQHSYFERLTTILRSFAIEPEFSAPMEPTINVVVPTIRPEQVPYIIRTFQLQGYRNCHLTIVANGCSIPDDVCSTPDIDADRIRLCYVPADRSIGYCMNYGIDQVAADYWAKMDDDDIYGPNFLSDMMLWRRQLDFDIGGKAAIFAYFEETDDLCIRRMADRDLRDVNVTGGSLVVRNHQRYFPEDVRGFADTRFLLSAAARGDLILAADPFNFVQVRRADSGSHTWTALPHTMNLSGYRRPGLDLDYVCF